MSRFVVALACALTLLPNVLAAAEAPALKGALLIPAQATKAEMASLAAQSFNAVVLLLEDSVSPRAVRAAAARARRAKLQLFYWIEIGRNPSLADAHPELMASLQTHPEWRRRFPSFPAPTTNQVVKNYPWVPVLYAESFPLHLQRVEKLLRGLPKPSGVFLNDLQGPPSACGCGNDFCRWTTDYGPLKTAQRLGDDAAAKFVAAVGKLVPGARIIPIWTTECAEHDREVACGRVSCFTGKCWPEYNAQLQPVAKESEWIGVRLPLSDFSAAESRSGAPGEWQSAALRSFSDLLPQRGGHAVSSKRLVSIVQGWEVTAADVETQLRRSAAAGVGGIVVAFTAIEQGWQPKLFTLPANISVPADARHRAH
ncbi:MAG: hypothetical protein HY043_02160 [Verrucomicrobia bacterium]|nr:hypothetical protein [Verrucomicrobiota bacterium]